MKAYEFPATITADGDIEIPTTLTALLPPQQEVRVIVLVAEPAAYDDDMTAEEENALWNQFAASQLLRHYGPEDEIYDEIEP